MCEIISNSQKEKDTEQLLKNDGDAELFFLGLDGQHSTTLFKFVMPTQQVVLNGPLQNGFAPSAVTALANYDS